jgi:hypothetical protein
MDWVEYFNRRPVGWRDDHRACYGLSAQGVKAKPHELFNSLYIIEKEKEEAENESTEHDAQKLVSSPFFTKMLQDTDWDIDVGV